MSDTSESINDKLRLLQKRYIDKLPESIEEIKRLWLALTESNWQYDTFVEFYRQVHNLSGSGATFGLTEVSTAARSLEAMLHPYMEEKKVPDRPTRERMVAGIAALDATVSSLREESAEKVRQSRREAAYPDQSQLKSGTLIYVVEDDKALREDLCLQLENFGYDVKGFSSPDEFEKVVADNVPKAAIIDIVFPGNENGGLDAIGRIRKGDEKGFPVFFISQRNDFHARLMAVRSGADGYFVKPLDIPNIIDTLDRSTAEAPADPLRILIVDDEEEVAQYHASLLEEEGITTLTLTDPTQILDRVSEFAPDMILTDLYMPQCTGIELASVIRQIDAHIGLPIVYLSGEQNIQKRTIALKEGADDFLIKPVDPYMLVLMVKLRAERFKALRNLMVRDSLTGLLNHTHLTDCLTRELSFSRRSGKKLCFAMIDIDHFKQINDRHGHQTGDQVIKGIARLLQQRLRGSDVIGRYGGEEFAVIFRDTDKSMAHKVMEELRHSFEQIKFYNAEEEFSVTFSCGISDDDGHGSLLDMVERADQAMYLAKEGGRNRIVVA